MFFPCEYVFFIGVNFTSYEVLKNFLKYFFSVGVGVKRADDTDTVENKKVKKHKHIFIAFGMYKYVFFII